MVKLISMGKKRRSLHYLVDVHPIWTHCQRISTNFVFMVDNSQTVLRLDVDLPALTFR